MSKMDQLHQIMAEKERLEKAESDERRKRNEQRQQKYITEIKNKLDKGQFSVQGANLVVRVVATEFDPWSVAMEQALVEYGVQSARYEYDTITLRMTPEFWNSYSNDVRNSYTDKKDKR